MTKKFAELPGWPRGLSHTLAAAYVGVSTGLFDEMVSDGRMPPAVPINRRMIWDLRSVDLAFTALSDPGSSWVDQAHADLGGPPPRRFGDRLGKKVEPPSAVVWFDEDRDQKWEADVRVSPLGTRERIGLEGYVRGKGQSKVVVPGAGINTIDRLVVRGYIQVESERGKGKVPYYGITEAGEKAWLALNSAPRFQ